MSGFDWNDDADIVLRSYGCVAVHENPHGDVVVRQESTDGGYPGYPAQDDDENRFVVLPLQDAEHVAQAIIAKVKEIRTTSAAERQAKHEGQQAEREPRLALPAPAHPTARPTRVARDAA